MAANAQSLAPRAASLAGQGVFIGTSSWKYPGWCGHFYDESRYIFKGKFSTHRFERLCLAEYATIFKTVCVDAAYYRFPSCEQIGKLVEQAGPDFQFAFKVTGDITIKRFANLPRHGINAGRENVNFLNADLFQSQFLAPCEQYKDQIGILMFEFSKFYPADFERGRDFVERLDQFLEALPKGWNYGVEIRNRFFLKPAYFDMLRKHQITHVFSSWQDMPPISEQWALEGSRTSDSTLAARLLLRPGRKYEEAVKLFSPYREVKDPYPEGRAAAAAIAREVLATPWRTRAFIFVNNRFEGNSLQTIDKLMDEIAPPPAG